jgi:hypothetical protein
VFIAKVRTGGSDRTAIVVAIDQLETSPVRPLCAATNAVLVLA